MEMVFVIDRGNFSERKGTHSGLFVCENVLNHLYALQNISSDHRNRAAGFPSDGPVVKLVALLELKIFRKKTDDERYLAAALDTFEQLADVGSEIGEQEQDPVSGILHGPNSLTDACPGFQRFAKDVFSKEIVKLYGPEPDRNDLYRVHRSICDVSTYEALLHK